MQLVIQQRHRFSQVSGDSIPKKSKPRACDMPPDFETCFSRQAWKSARAHRPAIGSKAKQAGRHQIDHYLVASGSMAWSGCGPQHFGSQGRRGLHAAPNRKNHRSFPDGRIRDVFPAKHWQPEDICWGFRQQIWPFAISHCSRCCSCQREHVGKAIQLAPRP